MLNRISVFLLSLISFLAQARQIPIRHFTEDNGLPQNYVYDICQNPLRHLYIATGEGLSDYNGYYFRNQTTQQGLSENFVRTCAISPSGAVWLGYFQAGISFEKKGKFVSATGAEIEKAQINKIQFDSFGYAWAASPSGIFLIDSAGKAIQPIGAAEIFATDLCVDRNGQILAATDLGFLVLKYNPKQNKMDLVQLLTMPDQGLAQKMVYDKSQGICWIVVNEQFLVSCSEANQRYSLNAYVQIARGDEQIKTLVLDKKNNLWLGGPALGIVQIAMNKTAPNQIAISEHIGIENGMPPFDVQVLFCDDENTIWAGLYGGGIAQINSSFFYSHPSVIELGQSEIAAIGTDDLGNIYTGAEQGFLFYEKGKLDGNPKHFKAETGFTNEKVTAFGYSGPNERMYIGTIEGSVFEFDPVTGRSQKINQQYQLVSKTVNRIVITPSGNVMIATIDGLNYLHDKKVELLNTEKGLLHNNISDLCFDKEGRIWFASHGAPPFYMEDSLVTSFQQIQGQTTFNFNACIADKNGHVWYASEGDGLFEYDGKEWRRHSVEKGLLSNYCYGLIEDVRGNIWVTHKNGTSRISGNQIEAFTKSNGFLSSTNQKNAMIIYRTQVLFGTENGIMTYESDYDYANGTGPVSGIEEVLINGERQNLAQNGYDLSYAAYAVRINFSGLLLRSPEKVKIRYRLKGHEEEWIFVNGSGTANYPKLKDGDYLFELETKDETGRWIPIKNSILIQIAEPFWKRWWFFLLVFAGLVFAFFFLLRVRTHALIRAKERLEMIVNEKTAELKEEKKQLEISKGVIEEQNEEITASIRYAERIQQALLPDEQILRNAWGHFFIYFKPRDIVSGDFYWMNEQEDAIYFAVADCTGHGVPGAFMSFIGSTLLTQLITEQKLNSPAQIAKELNRNFASVLHRKGSNHMYDGMEIMICRVSKREQNLTFVGAARPLWIIRNGQLEEFKTSPFPVDGNDIERREYKETSLRLFDNDSIYISSDGYYDQFGEETNRRMGLKRFKLLLEEMAKKPISEQQVEINRYFENWKGQEKQIDDVLVVGINIRTGK
jgi:ligand-binding sensor domain-containing protein/serine phosphatase RsbU (regulator of sigma subunit)